MAKEYFYKTRILPSIGSAAILVVVLYFSQLPLSHALLATASGGITGLLTGHFSWRHIRPRIYTGNRLIIYSTDGILYAFLVVVAIVSLVPRAFGHIAAFAVNHPEVSFVVALLLTSLALTYSLAMFWLIRRYERQTGPLRIKTQYAPSSTGAEGMLGKQAVVQNSCSPEGTVQVGNELWRARALDNAAINAGESVVVRDIEGLCLLVERPSHEAV